MEIPSELVQDVVVDRRSDHVQADRLVEVACFAGVILLPLLALQLTYGLEMPVGVKLPAGRMDRRTPSGRALTAYRARRRAPDV